MATITQIKEAIVALKDRTGSSLVAINKWLETEKQVTIKPHVMKAALKKGVETGTLVKVKASYKVSAEAKKPVVKKAAPKTPVVKVKTTVAKKKTVAKKEKTTTPTKKAAPKKKTATKKASGKPVAKKAKATPKKASASLKTKKAVTVKKTAPKKAEKAKQ